MECSEPCSTPPARLDVQGIAECLCVLGQQARPNSSYHVKALHSIRRRPRCEMELDGRRVHTNKCLDQLVPNELKRAHGARPRATTATGMDRLARDAPDRSKT